jgi:rRNA processing protein Gar1
MSFRSRGQRRGFGGRGGGGRGGGRGGRFQQQSYGPPDYVTEVGSFMHACEEDLVCKGSIEKVPYFNAPIYLENKSQIGKVDEIFGPINGYLFSVKLLPDMKASSFKSDQKVHTVYVCNRRGKEPCLAPSLQFTPLNGVSEQGKYQTFLTRVYIPHLLMPFGDVHLNHHQSIWGYTTMVVKNIICTNVCTVHCYTVDCFVGCACVLYNNCVVS